jgi:hypothetical protein
VDVNEVVAVEMVELNPTALAIVKVYPVTGEPPLFAGAPHVSIIDPSPTVARKFVGTLGGPIDVPFIDAIVEVPIRVLVDTENVYNVPSVRPEKRY